MAETAKRQVNVRFELQPKQFEVRQLLKPVHRPVVIGYGGARAGGKASPFESRILTPKGWTTMGEVKVGDVVTDPTTGGQTRVIAYHPQGMKKVYRVTTDDGGEIEVVGEHLWAFRCSLRHRPRTKIAKQSATVEAQLGAFRDQSRWATLRVGDTNELRRHLADGMSVRIPLTEPVMFTVNGKTGKGLVEPYLAGLMLGDGHLPSFSITTTDDGIREYLLAQGFSPQKKVWQDGKPMVYIAAGKIRKALDEWLRGHGLRYARSADKFIPDFVLTAPIEYRLEFLRGLMDTDGTIDDRGRASFTSVSYRLAEGVQTLVWGLGGKARIKSREVTFTYKGERRQGKTAHTVVIRMRENSTIFRLERKKKRSLDRWGGGAELMREIVSIVEVGEKECACITVDSPFGLYVGDDYIVTHNSHLLRAFALEMLTTYERITIYVIRKTMDDLRDNHITPMFIEYPWTSKFWKEQKKTLKLPGYRELRFISGENPLDIFRLAGKEAAFVLVDQAEQFTQEELEFMRTLNRWTKNALIRPKMLLTFNPGGIGAQYLRRVFIQREFEGNEVGDDYAFVQAYGWDNVEWFRPWLNRRTDLMSDVEFYKLSDQDRFRLFITETDNGKTLNALPEDRRAAQLLGDWFTFSGQFFSGYRHAVHVLKGKLDHFPQPAMIAGAIDYGRRTVMELGFRTEDGRVEIFDECYTEEMPPLDHAKKQADLIEKWELWNLHLLYDTNMNADSRNYHGTDKRIITWFREEFERRFKDKAPILIPVSKRSPDARAFRVVCNEAFKQFLAFKRHPNDTATILEPPKMQFRESCRMLIKTLPELQYPEHEKHDGLDFDPNIGIDDPFDATKYLLMYLQEAWQPDRERPITNEQEYFERIIVGDLLKRTQAQKPNIYAQLYADTL